jgi:hypothetical protein
MCRPPLALAILFLAMKTQYVLQSVVEWERGIYLPVLNMDVPANDQSEDWPSEFTTLEDALGIFPARR